VVDGNLGSTQYHTGDMTTLMTNVPLETSWNHNRSRSRSIEKNTWNYERGVPATGGHPDMIEQSFAHKKHCDPTKAPLSVTGLLGHHKYPVLDNDEAPSKIGWGTDDTRYF